MLTAVNMPTDIKASPEFWPSLISLSPYTCPEFREQMKQVITRRNQKDWRKSHKNTVCLDILMTGNWNEFKYYLRFPLPKLSVPELMGFSSFSCPLILHPGWLLRSLTAVGHLILLFSFNLKTICCALLYIFVPLNKKSNNSGMEITHEAFYKPFNQLFCSLWCMQNQLKHPLIHDSLLSSVVNQPLQNLQLVSHLIEI